MALSLANLLRTFAATAVAVAALHIGVGAQRPVKVLLLYDMEGITAAAQPTDVSFGSPTYERTRESLVEDVNAAIRGLQKAGATEIVVTDGHGSGNPNPDYILERLPPGARHDIRDVPYDPYIETMDGSFTAMVAIAMHGKAGGRGFLAHTYNGHTRWVMGGHDMNESMLVAASAARFDVPLILVTGDDVLRAEVKAFSRQTEYVVVKKALGVEQAEPRPRADVSADIEAAAERALRDVKNIPPWKPALGARFDNHYGYILPAMTAIAINFPGATLVDDKTINVPAGSFLDAYLAFRALARFTGAAEQRVLVNGVREEPGGPELLQKVAMERLPARHQRTFAPTGTTISPPYGRHGYR